MRVDPPVARCRASNLLSCVMQSAGGVCLCNGITESIQEGGGENTTDRVYIMAQVGNCASGVRHVWCAIHCRRVESG